LGVSIGSAPVGIIPDSTLLIRVATKKWLEALTTARVWELCIPRVGPT
jgi:hypothetical protein